MRAPESKQWTAVDATPAQFVLYGGVYVLSAVATWGGGDVVVERLLPDGTSLAPTHTALSADGITDPIYLPPGKYSLTITTATDVTAELSRVPFE